MSFSIKNIFQKGDSADHGGMATLSSQPSSFSGGQGMPSPFTAVAASEPGGFGGTLFRTVGGVESMDGEPFSRPPGASPFSPFGAATNAVITVGDILPQLPPEIARVNGAMPDQPVNISPQALEQAIASGQLAVPMFEIYRVCPALFQAPVSPHDPRLVPLPRTKLPGLIAAHTGALTPPGQTALAPPPHSASPYSTAPMQMPPTHGAPSPFMPALPDLPHSAAYDTSFPGGGVRPVGTLPPRRPQGMPPSIPTQADFASPPGMLTLPGQTFAGDAQRPISHPMLAPAHPEMQGQPFASPYAARPPQQVLGQTSLLFGSQPPSEDPELAAALQPSPQYYQQPGAFSFPNNGQPASSPSPFASMPQQGLPLADSPTASPFTQTPGYSPFGQPVTGSPFATPAVASFEVPARLVESEPPRIGNLPFVAQATHAPFAPPANFAPAPKSQAMGGLSQGFAVGNELMEISLAAVLNGQTAQNLGFDPSFIPGWITTKLPASQVRDQLHSGQVVLDLGTIIDGTESTFKSVIAHGCREFNVSIPTSEVFKSMPPAARTASAPFAPAAPAMSASAFAMPSLPPTPTGPLQPLSQPSASQRPSTVPLQPMSGAFAAQFTASPPAAPPTAPLMPAGSSPAPVPPAVGEFASTPMFMPSRTRDGMGSQQLFGAESKETTSPFAPAPEARHSPTRPLFAAAPALAPSADPPQQVESNPFLAGNSSISAQTFGPIPTFAESRTPAKPLNMVADMAKVFGNPAPAESAKSSTPAPLHRPVAEASNGNTFGMSAQGDEEQLVLRAMLGVSETLDLPRVLELTSRLPGVSACAHIRDAHVTADGDSSEPSQNFRQQAPDIARSMRTLAEVTGLDAETLSIATNDRQITFCFQGGSVFGVLHSDKTPPAGLREKITLLSREVARMSA